MPVYPIRKYPLDLSLRDGSKVTLRPMTADDGEALLAFFQRVPDSDRFFLKDDVASPEVVASFVEHLNYDRALPLLALDGTRVIANAVLIRHRGSYRQHGAEIRVVVEPDYRHRGLGVTLIRELADIAWDAELEFVELELIAGPQDDAIAAVESLGAITVATVSDYAKGPDGASHELRVARIPLGKWWQWSRF